MNNLRRRTLLSSSGGIDPTTGRGKIGNYEVVDLGLPSGLLWAACNVGANSETEYGDYYKYGSGSQKYDASQSSFYTGMEDPLDSSRDTATQVMGSGWRMPTRTEFQELVDKTNFEWVTNFNGSDINGGKFTSKTNPNAYVFFPAAGTNNNPGNLCYVWSSTPYDMRYAYVLFFTSNYKEVSSTYRYGAYSVRGVHAAV